MGEETGLTTSGGQIKTETRVGTEGQADHTYDESRMREGLKEAKRREALEKARRQQRGY